MGFQLTPESLRKLCRDLKLYTSCPELNDVLHLQCKGITRLENLDAYTGLKTLYLEQNVISEIENLDNLVNLRCLYLGKNMIYSTLGLQALTNLETLDLAENVIATITDLSKLPLLRTLNISGNRLHTVDDIRDLAACSQLQSLDMASNRLEATEAIDFVMTLPLLYLRLQGNPAVSNYTHYRKTLLARMPALNYLDDSPVFPKDRRLAAAFVVGGGIEAERAMRETIRREEEATREAHRRAFDEMVERARQQPPEPHDPMRFRAVPPGESDSDEEGLPALYRRRNRAASAAAAAAAASSSQAGPSDAAAAAANGGSEANGHVATQEPAPAHQAAAPGLADGRDSDGVGAAAADAAASDANGAVPAAESATVEAATLPTHGSLIVRLEEELRDLAASATAQEPAASTAGGAVPGGAGAGEGGIGGGGGVLLQASLARLHAGISNMSNAAQPQLPAQPMGGGPGAPLARLDFREELRERAIARAAARAELASAMTAAAAAGGGGGGADGALSTSAAAAGAAGGAAGPSSLRGASHPPRASRPVWRTPDYQRLWSMAVQLGEAQEQAQAQAGQEEPQQQDAGGEPELEAAAAAGATAPSSSSGAAGGLLRLQEPRLLRYVAAPGGSAAAGDGGRGGRQSEEALAAAGLAAPPHLLVSLDLLAAPEAPTPDEAQSIADSAMGYDRIQRGGAGGGGLLHGGRDADLDSARSRGEHVSDLDLRTADLDLDSARGALVRPGGLGDIDSARSYSRPASSRGDPDDEDEEVAEEGPAVEVEEEGGGEEVPPDGERLLEEDDVDLELLAAAAAAAAAAPGDSRDLYERYSVTAYGRGDTSHLRQRRNSGGGGGASSSGRQGGLGSGGGSGLAATVVAGSPLRRGSSAMADLQAADRYSYDSASAVHGMFYAGAADATTAASGDSVSAAGSDDGAVHSQGAGPEAPDHPSHYLSPPHARTSAAGIAAAESAAAAAGGAGLAAPPQDLQRRDLGDSPHMRPGGGAGPAAAGAPASPSYGRRSVELPSHVHPGHGQVHWSLRRTDTANRMMDPTESSEGGGDGGAASGSGHVPQQPLRQYDSDVELALAAAAASTEGQYDSDDDGGGDVVVADPAELLQRARSILSAEAGAVAAGGAAAGGGGASGAAPRNGTATPADLYHQLAGQLQDPDTLAAARQAVLGSLAPASGTSGSAPPPPGNGSGGGTAGGQLTDLYELD
ncbi:hypothetical protein PLESTF_000747100 [Pleodorina starrii]|nr:hypothetical protein PLESTM_001812800 [Pleodorina starrii]GLC68868.1 hypothetical protein PLESTF_000747100 [Pleodorina starrii]